MGHQESRVRLLAYDEARLEIYGAHLKPISLEANTLQALSLLSWLLRLAASNQYLQPFVIDLCFSLKNTFCARRTMRPLLRRGN